MHMSDHGDAMSWHVQYRRDAGDYIVRRPSPEAAIEAACRLIDFGCDVYGIGTGPFADNVERDDIVHIYAMWVRAKRSLGLELTSACDAE